MTSNLQDITNEKFKTRYYSELKNTLQQVNITTEFFCSKRLIHSEKHVKMCLFIEFEENS